jgi:predicted N-acyltransferase
MQNNLSSAHLNFIDAQDRRRLEDRGWLIRKGLQFHWHNQNYQNFDSFLDQLSSRKRKNIRKERQSLSDRGVEFHQLTAESITAAHWDSFYQFYLSTIERKWGGAYLTEAFFHQIGEQMADRILLIFAQQDGRQIAAALNFIGKDTLYGRNWGCSADIPNLHFETCYYQAIEFAISHGLDRVEAGAQGFHKVQRGYMPCYTYSAHLLAHQGMSEAVQRFLQQENAQIMHEAEAIGAASPYRKSG